MNEKILNRILSKCVRDVSGCVLWTGTATPCGYGRMSMNRRRLLTHRAVFELHNGPIPTGMCICHKCDTPACCNIDHLFMGTMQDNMDDRGAKGRNRVGIGEKQHLAVLTEELVRDIRKRSAEGEACLHISRSLKVGNNTVWNVIKGNTWRHV